MKRLGAMLLLASALSLIVWQGVASASGKLNVSWTMHGTYVCSPSPMDCETTAGSGTARANSSVLGGMTWTNSSGGGVGNPVCPRNLVGFSVSETWVFTTQDGDHLFLTTDSDSLCLVSKQVATETATFTITGGTGGLTGTSGTGTFTIVDLTSPSNENGNFNATINLS
jgi:hypothetical protein